MQPLGKGMDADEPSDEEEEWMFRTFDKPGGKKPSKRALDPFCEEEPEAGE